MRVWVRKNNELLTTVEVDGNIRLGRSHDNEVVLPDEGVSRHHAKIEISPGGLILEDLKSPNGTLVNGEPVEHHPIKSGDQISIGPFQIELELNDPPPILKTFLQDDSQTLNDTPELSNARLVRLDGKSVGEKILLDEKQITIGKAPASAIIEKSASTVILKNDLDSTHTFVDGVPVRERQLETHDIIQVGSERYEYVEGRAVSYAERSKVLERKPQFLTSQPLSKLLHWKWLLPAGVLIGIALVWVAPRKTKRVPPPPSVVETESVRLTRFHLGRAQELISKRKFDEAEARIHLVLDEINPGNIDAKKTLQTLEKARVVERNETEEERRVESEKDRQVKELLGQGDQLLEAKKFDEALRLYRRALSMDDQNRRATAKMDALRENQERARRELAARQKSSKELERLYKTGVLRFESGDYKGALRPLTEVSSRKGHRYQASAKKLIEEIKSKTDRKIEEKLKEAKALNDSGDILRAYEEVSRLLANYPRNDEAEALIQTLEKQMLPKAKQAYTEGIAYQELAEDTTAALERYQEVLRYAPNPKNDYHRKAQKKLDELKSAHPTAED